MLEKRIAQLESGNAHNPANGLGGFHDPRWAELTLRGDEAGLKREYPRWCQFFADLLRAPEELPEAVAAPV